uniref:Ovule protein n=1 Tax=Caenorhabditis tropicalis TaxID=1561998 RepID=A0A1I7TNS5_9PELO
MPHFLVESSQFSLPYPLIIIFINIKHRVVIVNLLRQFLALLIFTDSSSSESATKTSLSLAHRKTLKPHNTTKFS